MSINLQKGQKISLSKEKSGLSKILVGLGWDPVDQKGFFKKLFAKEIDCDASMLLLNAQGKLASMKDLIFFGNLTHESGAVVHQGDNLTGEGDGDDEQIIVELNKVDASIEKLLVVVNIYDCTTRGQHFGMINNAFIRICDASDGKELVRYNLSDDYNGKTALYAGEVYRHEGEWKFNALGDATTEDSLKGIVKKYS